MARYLEIHPENPQARLLGQAAEVIAEGGVIAYPTDSGYALGCSLGNKEGLGRIRQIRQLTDKHHFTLMCASFAQLGPLVIMSNQAFRLLNHLTPGPYTFILQGTREVPRMTLHPKKHTVGARIPDHKTTLALLAEHGEPLLTSSLILPGQADPMVAGWEVRSEIGHLLDAIIEGPAGEAGPTTVIDFTGVQAEIVRVGAGPIDLFD